nr:ATP-dependent DNA helicase PIF1-like [Tanacetum cinerariifolium]
MSAFTDKESLEGMDPNIVQRLIEMLNQSSFVAKAFRMAINWSHTHGSNNVHLKLLGERMKARQYNKPMVAEVAALITNYFGDGVPTRDIIVDKKDSGPKRISELHPSYMTLQYPLLFPYGEDGFHVKIPYPANEGSQKTNRGFVTMKEFYAYSNEMTSVQRYYEEAAYSSNTWWMRSQPNPSQLEDPEGYKVVAEFMLHGPCGKDAKHDPCNIEEKCSKHFPKSFNEETIIDADGYPIYRRRDKKSSATKGKFKLHDCFTPKEGIDVTMFTDWFELNKHDPEAKTLTYAEIPKHYAWHEKLKLWKQRKQQKCIGRIVYSSPASDSSNLPKPNPKMVTNMENRLIREALAFDMNKSKTEHQQLHVLLNPEQRLIYEQVLHYVYNQEGQFYFVHGPGGTGKTFRYKTIMARLRSERMIVLAVASSGIVSLLLPVELMQQVQLIIWDEAPMTQKYAFEALDKTLRDILGYKNPHKRNQLFGDLTVLLGGNFRQILPVIPKGKCADIIQSCINRSQLWKYCKVFTLTRSMRVNEYYVSGEIDTRKQDFNQWVLVVGDGAHDDDYQKERAILTLRNDDAYAINAYMFKKLAGDTVTYNSADEICKASTNTLEQHNIYPIEFLNSLNFPSVPPHSLCLKKELPIMLIRNVNPRKGLCNGTRLIITDLGQFVIWAKILTGSHVVDNVLIYMIILRSIQSKWPFVLNRRQFPIRPCYAMTINKSQGQSLNHVGLYLPNPVFSHGQLYVALSRVIDLEGLKILMIPDETRNYTITPETLFSKRHSTTLLNKSTYYFNFVPLFTRQIMF